MNKDLKPKPGGDFASQSRQEPQRNAPPSGRDPTDTGGAPAPDPAQGPEDDRVHRLENELRTTREALQSTIEKLEAANAEQARLVKILDSLNEAIISFTLEGIITSWNPGAESLYSYRAEEVVGHSVAMLYPEGCQEELTHMLTGIRSGRSMSPYQSRCRCKGGKTIQVLITVSPICDAKGKPVAGSIIAGDITERERTEAELFTTQQRLRAVMEALPVGIAFSRDIGCQAIDSNPALLSLFEARPDDNLSASALDPNATGRRTRYFSNGRELSGSELPLQRAVLEQTQIPAQEFEVQLPDGRRWLAEISGAPILDRHGGVMGGLAVVADITERKRAEQALVNADRKKNEFLAVLGHELRNPLAPIRNAVEIAARQPELPDKIRWAMDLIGRQSDQLERLVDDLLDVARITSGRIQLRLSPIALQDALEDALQSIAPFVEQYRHTLETRLPGAPVLVMADRVRLAQIFTNLLSNAVKYTPDRGRIQVVLTREAQDVVLRIRDNGIGIRAEDLPGLFDIFSRGVHERDAEIRTSDGLGVGLSLVRQLVQQHHGVLNVHSDGPGQGSEFIVSLPVFSDPKAPQSSEESDTGGELPPQARRILVVDDNPDVTNSFKILLQTMGHHVRALNTSGKTLEAIRDFHPDVVFLDIGMPDMDGFQVVRRIRAADLETSPLLVALTGYSRNRDRETALESGFDHHLLKPVAPKQIETLLAELK